MRAVLNRAALASLAMSGAACVKASRFCSSMAW